MGEIMDTCGAVESITVNVSINLIGEDKNTTIIEGFENGLIGIEIKVDFVNVTGFTVCRFRWGIASGVYFFKKNNCNIYDNIFRNNSFGIYAKICDNNTFSNNIKYFSFAYCSQYNKYFTR